MIIVTGATGELGSRVVRRLAELVPADHVGVSVRDASRAAHLTELGIRVRTGDFTHPETLEHAFEGADQVLVISAAIRGDGAFRANSAAIDAAVAAGASRVLYTSHQAASPDSLFPPQRVHAATEAHLAGQGMSSLALRNGFYADSLRIHLDSALTTGEILVPEDGPVSWTAHDDLAEAAARILIAGDDRTGATPPLTAQVALDLGEIAAILTKLTGRSIKRVTVSDEEWKASAIERGMPAPVADFSLGMFLAARRGEFAVVDDALADILRRPTLPVEHTLQRLLHQR